MWLLTLIFSSDLSVSNNLSSNRYQLIQRLKSSNPANLKQLRLNFQHAQMHIVKTSLNTSN